MHRIEGYPLWIGNAGDVRHPRTLFALDIEAVVDLAVDELPANLGREIVYCRFPLVDGPGNASWILRSAIETTARFITNRTATLVFCGHGMSRSPAIAAAALALASGLSAEQCLAQATQSAPHDVTPGLWQDVCAALAGLLSPALAETNGDS